MQDQISNIENVNDNSDDNTGASGGGGSGVDDGAPLRPSRRYEFDDLTRRLNKLHEPIGKSRVQFDDEPDMRDVLNNRLNRIRYGTITPNQEDKILAKRLAERQREIAQLSKGKVKSGKSDAGLFQLILPDTPPPTPIRDDYWLPLPVVPSDNNFIKPQLPRKPQFLPKTKPQLLQNQ